MNPKSRGRRFFVLHLPLTDRPSQELRYEIQVLNSKGEAVQYCYAPAACEALEVGGIVIPLAVIEAAKRQAIGTGDYVDETGSSIKPF